MLIVVVALFAFHATSVESRLAGAFVMPHGGIALDPKQFKTDNDTLLQEAWALHNSCVAVGKEVMNLKPDVVFISTPHGIADLNAFLFYLNDHGYGSADTDNCLCPPCCYTVGVSLDFDLSMQLVDKLKDKTSNVSGINGFGEPGNGAYPFPLKWGEVIPLYFSLGLTGLNQTTKVIVLSQPSRRYNHSVSMISELLELGTNMYNLLDNATEKVAVIISGDLAHTHLSDGPYGYSNASEPFDQACGKWAATLDEQYLIKDAAYYADRALSCGFTGFVMLQGMLSVRNPGYWTPRLYVNYHPSYYGMMVASFLPSTEECLGSCWL